jgi:hypothetical protein
MSKTVHNIYISSMVIVVLATTCYLAYYGFSYYSLPLEERFYHDSHNWFKPSGAYGHGLGIIGTLMILFGVIIYIARKRYNFLASVIRLKYLLEFHIFLCTLGPILILFHTAFKFGGIVSIAFWSMVAVVLSGVIGRFVYIQIPRTIDGRELTMNELSGIKSKIIDGLKNIAGINDSVMSRVLAVAEARTSGSSSFISQRIENRKTLHAISGMLKVNRVESGKRAFIIRLLKDELNLNYKVRRLQLMKKLLSYWHVAHLPFAIIMLIILVIHVVVTLSFGYKWIF